MSTLYVDLSSGNDATGDGSGPAPFLTVGRATVQADAPHDIRIAKTPDPIIITANTLWTVNTTSISAARNLTSEIVVGDFIGKPSASGNGYFETYYRVNNITSTTITIEQKYFSPVLTTSEVVSSLKLIQPIITGNASLTTRTILVSSSNTIISGGWDLTLSAQNGETWFKPYGNRTLANANSYGISVGNGAVVANNPTISNINLVDTNIGIHVYGGATIARATVKNCTIHSYTITNYLQTGISAPFYEDNVFANVITYGGFYILAAADVYMNRCLFMGGIYAGIFQGVTPRTRIQDCIFFAHTSTGIGSFSNGDVTFLGINKFYYVGGFSLTIPANYILENCNFYNCSNGVNTAANSVIKNCYFENITTSGIQSGDSQNSNYVYNCIFKNCLYGILNYRIHGLLIEDCYFDSCTYGVRHYDAYSGETTLINCNFNAPSSYALYKVSGSKYMKVINCNIDSASLAKAYTDASPSYYYGTQWIFINSFGKNGTSWGCGGKFQDYTNFRTTAPGLAITWNATTTKNNMPMKVMSTMINSGASATFNMYIKTANVSWSGTLDPVWRLNESVIKSETRVLSTDLTTLWRLCSWAMESSYITADGELSFEFIPNMNTYSLYLDDFTVT